MRCFVLLLFLMINMLISSCSSPNNENQNKKIVKEPLLISSEEIMTLFPRLKELPSTAPVASRKEHSEVYHGDALSDPYFWLKDQSYPDVDDEKVLGYLKAENAYHKSFLDPHAELVDTIFEEMKGRTDEQETSVPYIYNGYEYRWLYREGEEYRVRIRKNLKTEQETTFLDENALAQGHDYFVLGDWAISPDKKDLVSGEYLSDELNDVQGELSFSTDGKSLIYSLLEQDKWLAKNINVHRLGTKQSSDKTIYHETDDGFFIGFSQTSDEKYFVIVASQGERQESY